MATELNSMDRRALLAAGGLGAFAALTVGPKAEAADLTEAEKANVDLIERFCKSWDSLDAAKIGEFLSDDCVYRMTETTPAAEGKSAIVERLGQFLARAQKAEFAIVRTYAIGPIVIDERYDRFTMGQSNMEFHVAGLFFIKDGKIKEWTDFMIPKSA